MECGDVFFWFKNKNKSITALELLWRGPRKVWPHIGHGAAMGDLGGCPHPPPTPHGNFLLPPKNLHPLYIMESGAEQKRMHWMRLPRGRMEVRAMHPQKIPEGVQPFPRKDGQEKQESAWFEPEKKLVKRRLWVEVSRRGGKKTTAHGGECSLQGEHTGLYNLQLY